MTTNTNLPAVEYIEDGATLTHAVPFKFLSTAHLVVHRIAADGTVTALTYGVDYTATGAGEAEGDILKTSAGTVGTRLRIRRETPRAQGMDYTPNDTFPAESHESALDRAMLIDQEQDVQIADSQTRALLVPDGEAAPELGSFADLTEGDVLVFRDGVLQKHDRAQFAGKYFGGDGTGGLVPVSGSAGGDGSLRTDLADVDAGDSLVTYQAAGTDPTTQTARDWKRNRPVHLLDYVPKAQWAAIEAGTSAFDASDAFANALATGKRVILPIGTVLANLPAAAFASGAELEGECRRGSIVRPFDAGGHLFLVDSGAAASFVEDLRFANFTAYGYIETEGFLEQSHLFFLNGVKRALLENLTIKGFRGDGVCLGSGLNTPGVTERHNHAVLIRNFEFDGITTNNRNAISVLDCDGLTVRDGDIRRTSRNGNPAYIAPADYDVMDPSEGRGMPGPIDFEPDGNAFHVIRGVLIDNVRFFENGGNIAQVAFPVPAAVTAPVRNVTIRDCKSWDYAGIGYDVLLDTVGGVAAPAVDQAFRIENWSGRDGNSPFYIDRCRGVYVNGTWSDYAAHPLVGFEATTTAIDVTCDVRFKSVGDATGLYFCNVDGLTLSGKLDACAGDAAGKYPVLAGDARTSSRVTIDGLEIIKRAAQTIGIANQASGHTFTAATNHVGRLVMTGLTSELQHTAPGESFAVTFTWDPASLADGDGETKASIAVSGLAFGDQLEVVAPYDLQDMIAEAYVQAAGVAEARLQNEGGGVVDPASGTWTLIVTKARA